MRTRLTKRIEKVFSVVNGEGKYHTQLGITSSFQTLNRREALNRPTCKYFTPKALIEKVEYLKSVKQAEIDKRSGAIKEAREWASSLLVRSVVVNRHNVA